MLLDILLYTDFNSHLCKSSNCSFSGWLIANEQITTALLAATVIIIISVYLVLYDQFRDRKNKQREGVRD